MVPKRIKLAGFLCYRDEQEVAFDGSALWMLSGLNGSGKSSIFDAVTYALFGYHRGGSQGAAELINKGENGFAVEFDFQLEGALHRIKRTLKRRAGGTAATQQVLKWQPGAAPDDGEWEAIADTQRKVEFDNWVRDHIGLNYETFTSSVLLLQGRSEKLLDSTAKGRAEVLASIVDLERYQQLHERADGQRKTLRGQVETLQNQLNAIPEVTEIELLAALNRIEGAKEAVKLADAEVEQLQVLEYQSKQWAEVQRKLSAALARRAQAGKLIQDADKIEKELTRLRELRDVLPHVDVIFQRRNDLSGSEERTKVHAQELRDLEGKLGDLEHNLEQTRRRKAAGQKRIAADEARLQELSKSLPSLAAVLERVKLVEQRRADLRQLEEDLAKFPADLTVKVGDIQKKIDELTGLERAVSPLARLAEARRELKEARERAGDSERTEAQIKARGEEIRSRHDALKPSLETARVALRQVEEKLASERALLKQAAEQRDEFDHLDGAKLCRTCGQNLTPAHYREEKARRDKARAEAEDRVRQAQLDLKGAQAVEKAITDQFREADQQIQTARDEYRDARNHLQQAQKDVARLAQDCQRAYTELAEPFRRRVWADLPADWTATTFPTAAELDEARRSAMALPALRRELEHNRDALSRCNSLTTQIAAARVALADLSATVTGDPGEIRREFARLDAEGKALAEQLKASRSEERSAQSEIDSFAEESARLREAISDRTGKLRTEEATRKMCQQAIAAARKALPADWQSQADRVALAEMNRLRGEKEELERKDIEARAEQLRGARIEAESLRQTLDDLERERDQFPAEARRDLAEVQTQLAAARAAYSTKADALNSARNERANLDARAQQRQSLRTQLTGAERELKHCKTLAELLGRDRLQRHLVRQAERQIVDYANSVLDRLSGGTLMLRLVGGEDGTPTDQALELEAYNRATGQAPINVAFLSGSQRFRVAVSLALGIGQYASRLHRPIESVIIDEGFGCLDRQGRQVMIQELHNLRGHLHCILLVSHQEEFAEAFADGYRFELADGSTKISRFQR